MKKLLYVLSLAVLIAMYSCKQPCKGIVTYPKLDSRLPSYFYKPGSFWVYRDSASGNIDSQYVYSYQYRPHYRAPFDTPNIYYLPIGISGQPSSTYCGPYYFDDISMRIYSRLNGLLKDSFNVYAGSSDYNSPNITENPIPNSNTSSTVEFNLDWTQVGLLNYCFRLSPQGDTTGTWYSGVQPSVTSGTYNFQNVSLWTVQIGDGSSPWFTHPTDLYITSGSGIIKMVQHLPTGDVNWNLINYHIVP